MQHGQAMFTLMRDCKPRCKMKLYRAAWFQEDLYLPKVKMKALLFFLTCVSLQVSKRTWKSFKAREYDAGASDSWKYFADSRL